MARAAWIIVPFILPLCAAGGRASVVEKSVEADTESVNSEEIAVAVLPVLGAPGDGAVTLAGKAIVTRNSSMPSLRRGRRLRLPMAGQL